MHIQCRAVDSTPSGRSRLWALRINSDSSGSPPPPPVLPYLDAGVDRHGPRPPPIFDANSCGGCVSELDAENPARHRAWRVQSEGQVCPPRCQNRDIFVMSTSDFRQLYHGAEDFLPSKHSADECAGSNERAQSGGLLCASR